MTSILSVPITIEAMVHTIEGGSDWAEVPRFPGCVAQAETIEDLQANIAQAIEDWLSESPEKSEDEDGQIAPIQGRVRFNASNPCIHNCVLAVL